MSAIQKYRKCDHCDRSVEIKMNVPKNVSTVCCECSAKLSARPYPVGGELNAGFTKGVRKIADVANERIVPQYR